ncbi:hypothetical protein [Streptomyces sp. H27-D2]|uniref:hypothetical protein n=1 Tax=Streptomyces sp. H27-D2 TaxID=3046304 RepID=UPI002DBB681A|nr:hypothetical protein [Streptomyces sp. H27-D2]MEC4018354.1 hypothetical protein [Streptomyces sp. H27-D2]
MDQSGTAIESELLDLTGVTLEELRQHRSPERDDAERRLLQDLCHPATNLGDNTSSWKI